MIFPVCRHPTHIELCSGLFVQHALIISQVDRLYVDADVVAAAAVVVVVGRYKFLFHSLEKCSEWHLVNIRLYFLYDVRRCCIVAVSILSKTKRRLSIHFNQYTFVISVCKRFYSKRTYT